MRIAVEINDDNDAFAEQPATEIGRILRELAERLEQDGGPYSDKEPVLDVNGNTCGFIKLDKAEAPKPADTIQPARVWLVTVEDRYGHSSTVYSTEANAYAAAAAYCRRNWQRNGPEGDPPADDRETVRAYYDANELDADFDLTVESATLDPKEA